MAPGSAGKTRLTSWRRPKPALPQPDYVTRSSPNVLVLGKMSTAYTLPSIVARSLDLFNALLSRRRTGGDRDRGGGGGGGAAKMRHRIDIALRRATIRATTIFR